jgi:predicted RNA methylase
MRGRPPHAKVAGRLLTRVRPIGPKDRYAAFGSLLKNAASRQLRPGEFELLRLWERFRPESLRAFDQIPMQGTDLLCQVKLIASHLVGRRVAFIGDHDGTSLLLGLLSRYGYLTGPAHMALLDFDDRLLEVARELAAAHGFDDRLEGRLYNVFDPVPRDLKGRFDAFYTNPPYGASNRGASARLFATRGGELVGERQASGYLLLPADMERPWTREAMRATQAFLLSHGWGVAALIPQLHRYHLDDDAALMSSLLCVEREAGPTTPMPWNGQHVDDTEIPYFYGTRVLPPFPRYIAADGRELMQDGLSEGVQL